MADEKIGARNPYLVALRREKRREAPDDWIDLLKKTPGVSVDKSGSKRRIMIQADEDAIKQVMKGFGEYCYVEPLIKHHRSDADED